MEKIILTGSTGFVGQNLLADKLIVPYSLIQLQRAKTGTGKEMLYDEFWEDKSVSAHHYIHLAGKAHDLKNTSSDDEYYKVNYELTKQLYDRFLDDKHSFTFIYLSSVKAVADNINGWLTEDKQPEPVSAYGRSKIKAEQYIVNNRRPDKRFVILRPCLIHGPGNKGNLNLLHKIIKKGIPWPLGQYSNQRSFLSIKNLLFIIESILCNKVSEGIYNVADDTPLSTNELVHSLAEINGSSPKIWNTPKGMIEFIAKAGNVFPLPLNEERLDKLTSSYKVSNHKIKSELNIEQMPVSVTDGLKYTFSGLIND